MAGPRLNAESAAPSGVGRDGAVLRQQEQVPQHRDDRGPLLHRGLNQPAQVLPQLTTDGLQRDRIRGPEPSTTWRNEGQQRDNQLGRGELWTLLFTACLWGSLALSSLHAITGTRLQGALWGPCIPEKTPRLGKVTQRLRAKAQAQVGGRDPSQDRAHQTPMPSCKHPRGLMSSRVRLRQRNKER